tara:strand:- start:1189 stop:3051 length:1863 start_codon:yes stop_codon:yes gene_type:complete
MATTLANPNNLALSSPTESSSQFVPSQASLTRTENPSLREGQRQQNIVSASTTSAGGLGSLFSQPAIQKALPAIIAFTTIFLILVAYSWAQGSTYRSVYPELSEADRQSAFEELSGADFRARIDSTTGGLQVPSDRYHEARLFLAARGLPKSSAAGGISALNDSTSMTTSQFMEQVRYISAIEQELAQSITNIATIESARVHLAAPKQSVFVRNRTPAKASVVVAPYSGRKVSQAQVQAIVHLVASSVPYLAAGDVSVVDQRGELLTDDSRFSAIKMNTQHMSYKQKMEESYRSRINALLAPVVGMGNVRSEVEVQIDFTEIESTFEEYGGNENSPLARSESLYIERGAGKLAMGVPGATSNIDPSATLLKNLEETSPNQDGSGPMSSKTQRNYELDRTVRHVKRQGGKLERLSVAVVINESSAPMSANKENDSPDEDGSSQETAAIYTAEQIDRFTALVKGAIGFNAERGDVVTIISTKFEKQQLPSEVPLLWYENHQILGLIKNLIFALVLIAILFFVIRPTLKSYASPRVLGRPPAGNFRDDKDGELSLDDLSLLNSGGATSMKDLQDKLKPKKSNIPLEMLDTANTYDDKVSLVRLLVADDAKRVANVLKAMIGTA